MTGIEELMQPMLPPEETEPGLRLRLIAAGWFAGAACIPIMFFFVIIGRIFFVGPSDAANLVVACTFIFLPVIMAAFFGFLIGARILNERIVARSWSAMCHGAVIAILSYVGFMLTYAALAGLNVSLENAQFINNVVALFFIGAILVGWLIVIAGAIGGLLLFKTRNRFRGQQLIDAKTIKPVYLNLWATTVLLAVVFICWLPLRHQARVENAESSRRDLIHAVWSNDPDTVEKLLAKGLSVETTDVGGARLLSTAAEKGHTRIVKILLNHGANPNVTDELSGRKTPLVSAVVNADFESINALLDHGAEINMPDGYGRTPLMEAAWATNRETVKSLIERGADVNYRAPDGQTALSRARSNRDITPTRLDHDADAANSRRLDAGQNIIDSRDFEKPEIMKRARERHDAIIDLLMTYKAK